MSQKPHPTQTPEYWEDLARSERVFAQQKRTSRSGTVESIRAHEAAAAEYEETARRLRNEAVPTSSTIAAIVGVNAALYRIKDGRPAEAVEPLESALKALKGEPIAQAEPVRQLHSFSSIDCEKLIAATVPGGSVCDPQEVADSIRRYLDAWPSAQAEPQEPRS